MMNLNIRIAVRSMLLVGLLAWGFATSSYGQSRRIPTRPTPEMVYEGFTEPMHTIMVAATEIGRLEMLEVKVGDRVVTNQIIGKLDDQLQLSAVQIAMLQSTMTGERDAMRAEADLQEYRARTLRALEEDGLARPDELIRAETDSRVAAARFAAAEEQYQLRQLELRRFQLQLERRSIRAPMDGVISKVLRKPGEYLTPGDPSIVQLMVVDKLWAVFSVPIQDMNNLDVGIPALVFLRSSSRTIHATITSIAPEIDGESGTVAVRVELDNTDGQMLAGDRCTLQVKPGTGIASRLRNGGSANIGTTAR